VKALKNVVLVRRDKKDGFPYLQTSYLLALKLLWLENVKEAGHTPRNPILLVRQTRLMLELMERAKDLLVGFGHPKETISVLVEEREQGIARDIARAAQGGFDAQW
jgi:hypothetical protein